MSRTKVHRFRFITTILVTENWIEDGVKIEEEQIIKSLKSLIPSAMDNELLIKVNNIEKAHVSIESFKHRKLIGYK